MSDDIRNYGLGDSTQYLDGTPRVKMVSGSDKSEAGGENIPPCPNCGCITTCMIEVNVTNHPLLRRGSGVGTYIGCPACPWASPMIIIGGK